jgi:hypothetical protein
VVGDEQDQPCYSVESSQLRGRSSGRTGAASYCKENWSFEAFIVTAEFAEEDVWIVARKAFDAWFVEG